MNKIIVIIISFYLLSINLSIAETKDCTQYKKLSKEYAKCKAEQVKKKTIEAKDKVAKSYDKNKKKFNKTDLKAKLLKFKNSKSQKEFLEK